MQYDDIEITDAEVPQASLRILQHLVQTYASEVNKLNSVWCEFAEEDLAFKPHPRSSSVGQIIEHELLSERRFFGEFLGLPEVPANEVLPPERTPRAFAARMVELSRKRLPFLANQSEDWWLEVSILRRRARKNMDLLATRAAHCASSRATRNLSADVE